MKPKQTSTIIFKVSMTLILLLALMRLFEIQLLNSAFIFFYDITFLIGLLFLCVSLIYLVFSFPKFSSSWKSIGIVGLGIVALWTVPFSSIAIWADFNLKKAERIEFIEGIQTHTQLDSLKVKRLELTPENEHLSNGIKQVIVENFENGDGFFFYTYRGMTYHFSGFVYLSNEAVLDKINMNEINNSTIFDDPKEIKKMDENWYFVAN